MVKRGGDGKVRAGSKGWVKRGKVEEIQLQVGKYYVNMVSDGKRSNMFGRQR